MRRLAVVVIVFSPLGVPRVAEAQPADDTQRSLPPAIEAALGSPPADSPPAQGTVDPGYAERGTTRTPDQTYGSSATSVAADGSLITGLQLSDPDVLAQLEPFEVPEFHIVQRGDTLWDISEYYLSDPYLWPKLWSWNDHVTNAHWIFPGDRVRLYDPFEPGARPEGPQLAFSKTRVPSRVQRDPVLLTQTAFVDATQFDTAMTVIGGGDAKVMLTTLDTIYLAYEKAAPPIPGERLVVYAPQEKIYDLEGKNIVGYVVKVVGDVEVETIAREAVEGTVSSALNPIERGYKVGPLRRRYRRVDPVPATQAASGLIIATLNNTGAISIKKSAQLRRLRAKGYNDYLAGEEQFVIVNLGESNGLEVGNVLEVVRKGDAYTPKRTFNIPYEDGWPRRVIGALMVVEVLPTTALTLSIYSRREYERGDHVELRGPGLDRAGTQSEPERGTVRENRTVGAEGNVDGSRDGGKVEGGGGFSVGN